MAADKYYDMAYALKVDVLAKHKKWREVEEFITDIMPLDSTKKIVHSYDGSIPAIPGGIVEQMRMFRPATICYLFAARATALTNQGLPDLALEHLEDIMILNKKDPNIFLARGKTLLAIDRKKEGIKELKKAQELGSMEAGILLAKIK